MIYKVFLFWIYKRNVLKYEADNARNACVIVLYCYMMKLGEGV